MTDGYVELSGESRALALAELEGAVGALGGSVAPGQSDPPGATIRVIVPAESDLARLAGRLALARRTLVAVEPDRSLAAAAAREGASGASAAFRRLGTRGGTADATVRALGKAYVDGGGRIDLGHPARRYWLDGLAGGAAELLREVSAVDRASVAARAMPRLPFRRPVSLPPRFARAAVNLASVRPGDAVLDPFLGTGALLAEAALVGARVYGIDAEPSMVRGALRNFQHLGVSAEALVEGDARSVELSGGPEWFDAIVTDPPYGRSSATFGERPDDLVRETLARWGARVRPGGRVVVVSPGAPPPLPPPWEEVARAAVRAHRSLTREFRAYRRAR